ncbi:MAG: M67 family metallopeptidase [Chitinophagaceae bacterium]|nr:M67 family metallopeptidase [Chitinophagaceae bacterium]
MLYIAQEAKKQIIEDGIRTFPDECCGFLFGREKGEDRIIDKITVVTNVKEGDKRRRFKISATDYLKAEKYAVENSLILLGVYHSHPNHPSVPSEHDRVVAQPYFSYIIESIQDGKFATLQSWRLNDDFQFEEEQVKESAPASLSASKI